MLLKPYAYCMCQKSWCHATLQHLSPWLHWQRRSDREQQHQPGSGLCMQLVPRYQNLLHGAELVESQLKESFPEYLNAEIALRTVTDVSVAISWLKGSFFYIRVCVL